VISRILVGFCCLLALPAGRILAAAGPPLLTDDPNTPGPNRWEINTAWTLDRSAQEGSLHALNFDINYGLGDRVQLKFEFPWLLHDADDSPRESGVGDKLVGLKWRFLDQEQHAVSLSVYPQVEFGGDSSSGSETADDGGRELILPVELERTLGPVAIDAEVGYTYQQDSSDEVLYGLALSYAPTKKLDLLGEIHAVAERGSGDDERVFNLGLTLDFDETYTVLASAGRSLGQPEPDEPNLLVYLGLQLHLGKSSHPSDESGPQAGARRRFR